MKTTKHTLLTAILVLAVSMFMASCEVVNPTYDEFKPLEGEGTVKITLYDTTGFAYESHYLNAREVQVREVPAAVRFWRKADPAKDQRAGLVTSEAFKIESL